MNQFDRGVGTAVSLLTHYFETVFLAAGLSWNSDNSTEIEALVEAIIAEAKKPSDS